MIVIRDCRRDDLTTVVALCKQHANYEQCVFDPDGKTKLLADAIFTDSPKLYCWVVEVGNTLSGYCTFTFDYSTWDAGIFLHLDCLFLEASVRRLGIGEKVIQKLYAVALEKNCVNVQWQTPSFNVGAIKFYQRIGARSKEKIRFILDTSKPN